MTVQPGSIIPLYLNEIAITLVSYAVSGPTTINSGFTITDQIDGSSGNIGIAMSYRSLTSLSPVDPTWSLAFSSKSSSVIISITSALGNLVRQVATDYYNWQTPELDLVLGGAIPWQGEGHSGMVEWIHRLSDGTIVTRILPSQDDVDRLCHGSGISCSSLTTAATITVPVITSSYSPQSISLAIPLQPLEYTTTATNTALSIPVSPEAYVATPVIICPPICPLEYPAYTTSMCVPVSPYSYTYVYVACCACPVPVYLTAMIQIASPPPGPLPTYPLYYDGTGWSGGITTDQTYLKPRLPALIECG